MAINNKEIVRRLYKEMWNERKEHVAHELLSDSHALSDPILTGSSVGPEAYLGQVRQLVGAFPDLRFHIDELLCDKEKVVVSWVASGTHKGSIFGCDPTNRKISIAGITIHHLANGKILDSHAVWDTYCLFKEVRGWAEAHTVGKR